MSRRVTARAPQSATAASKAGDGPLRRKCACGTHTIGGAECDGCRGGRQKQQRSAVSHSECSGATRGARARASSAPRPGHDLSRIPARSNAPLKSQAKLAVGSPGDEYEREADRVAERVAGVSEPRQPRAERVRADGAAVSTAPTGVSEALRSRGRPLDSSTREFMESRFGRDFGNVRVHTDARAADSARGLNAMAFTAGRHIVFAEGQFAPSTGAGRRLLAHELTHTIQQARAPSLMLKPAPPAKLKRDHTKLKITTELASLDYYETVRLNESHMFEYFSDTWDATSTWRLYDAKGNLADEYTSLGGVNYHLYAVALKQHVEKMGPDVFGEWTLRYEKGAYYDYKVFNVGQTGKPAAPLSDAKTTPSFYKLRKTPGGGEETEIGNLPGYPVRVTVNDKTEIYGELWYQVTLRETIKGAAAKKGDSKDKGDLPEGTQAWVIGAGKDGQSGVIPTIPWGAFVLQLRKFEKEHAKLSLDERITKLRQWSHDDNLPFDSIIGTKGGDEYLNTRAFVKNEWQILKDAQIVKMPDGKYVDVYHLMVGLDVLPRKVEEQTYWSVPVGPNYSAALWAGDIGAGAAHAYTAKDSEWENKAFIPPLKDKKGDINKKREAELERINERYYKTRAPDSDLLGDIDAWGVDALRSEKKPNSIEALLTEFYTKTETAQTDEGEAVTVTNRRKDAIEKFLRAYGLNTDAPLVSQSGAGAKMAVHVFLFARIWLIKEYNFLVDNNRLLTWHVVPMTFRFLNWLDALAKANGAKVTAKPKDDKKQESGKK